MTEHDIWNKVSNFRESVKKEILTADSWEKYLKIKIKGSLNILKELLDIYDDISAKHQFAREYDLLESNILELDKLKEEASFYHQLSENLDD